MNKWTSFDTRWVLSLFGTAVGAGILYLPIRAGGGGFWPVVVMCFLIFPLVFLSHRALSRFVAQANGSEKDITHAAEEYFGFKTSIFISILYFFAIFPICLAYCVGITNTFESFIYHQLLPLLDTNFANFINQAYISTDKGMVLLPFYRALLVFILVSIFMLIMLFSEEFITKVCEWLVYPLCFVLFVFSLYLIPQWNLSSLVNVPNFKDFIIVVWLTLPVLVFAFNHSPAISTFSLSVKRKYDDYDKKSSQILFNTSAMLLVFVMFFVFSSVLSLSPQELQMARVQNIPVLSYFANKLDNAFISYGGPLVAFLAISSSFFGHYFGAREGAYGIVRKCVKLSGKNPNLKFISISCTSLMYVIMLLVGYYNPSVLGFIENLGGPIIAAILFLMPIIAIYSVSKLKKFQNKALDGFVFIMGILTIVTVIYVF
ncbi:MULTISPECIES: aromatic amino acid transport family protein [unclassified Campylobacter]|uniref:aromatic amino acid transport family protein n=1 Tax=unclassified Campylobacter TaxID=2593542 RepID=UPI0012382153|nr:MULTISPECIES: aromatic amino acid transport family protein [unclassified Campylobacter]KAA6227261.1 HAAAP family serine/threonine permease [Campylobacter sp. LR286c]KAA6227866.1 HAAAP family serine/threonine permease [Campylobacter sp. LR185c]KAA6228274.1 HAAAP family serine/threonine permease [Campylobacter sp. LR196d]KAA6229274.1 HAAAP family serine/threonine permease [Campylobacter sp. LR291e]KAA6231080.1 HAAAP family serine/threonine permease [Campylobacter sp. LR264d]